MSKSAFSILLLTLITLSCTTSGESNYSGEQALGSSIIIPNDTFNVDTALTVITWIGTKPTVQHNGIIRIDSGQIGFKDSLLVAGDLFISMSSLRIMDLDSAKDKYEKLYTHLMSDDFFDVSNHPQGRISFISISAFDSTKLDKSIAEFMVKKPTHIIVCDLTLRGVTRPIQFPLAMILKAGQLEMEGKFTLDRTKWDISYDDEATVVDKIKDQFIHNKVYVGFSLIAWSTKNKPDSTDNLSL